MAAVDPVGYPAEDRNEDDHGARCRHDRQQDDLLVHVEGVRAVGDGEHRPGVEGDTLGPPAAHAQQQVAPGQPVTDQLQSGDGGLGLGLLELAEGGRLHDLQPDIEADGDQDGAQREGDSPAPGQECKVGQGETEQRKDSGAQHQPDRETDLRQAAVQAAFAPRGVFDGHQHSPAPLAADGRSPGRV